MNQCPTFYGLDPRWFTWDRLYRIYVTSDRLCGAYVAGQIYDERSASIQLQSSYLFLRGRVQRSLQRRKDREERYDTMDPTDGAFLAEDSRNFHIYRNHVIKITVNRKRSLWTAYNVGTVNIELGDGRIQRFILVGDHDADAITETLRAFFPDTDAVGKSSPLPKKREPQRHDWIRFAVLSAFFFGFTLLSVVWALLRVQNLGYLVIGALNLWAAIHCVKSVRKYRALPVDRKDKDGA